MLEGFQKYLVEQGFKRTCQIYESKKFVKYENYESYFVSSYGPTEFTFTKGDFHFYWGLGLQGHSPYYFMPKEEWFKIVLSGDNEKDLNDIIQGKINKIDLR